MRVGSKLRKFERLSLLDYDLSLFLLCHLFCFALPRVCLPTYLTIRALVASQTVVAYAINRSRVLVGFVAFVYYTCCVSGLFDKIRWNATRLSR